MKLTIGTLCKL